MSSIRAGFLLAVVILVVACTSSAPPATSRLLATLPPQATAVPTAVPTAPSATGTAVAGTAAPTATPVPPPTSSPVIVPSAPPTSIPTAPPSAGATPGTGIAGDWTGTYQSTKFNASHGGFTVTFTQNGNTIAGNIVVDSQCVGQGTIDGSLSGNTITFGVVKAAENIAFTGQLSGNTLSGNYTTGKGCGSDTGTWSATRNT